jgi:hypothetical protein
MKKFGLLSLLPVLISLFSCKEKKTEVYRNCISDIQAWYQASDEDVRKRFDIYKELGTNVLRVELSWAAIEPVEGQWDYDNRILNYISIAQKYGFRVKLIMGVMMGPPQWYFVQHPEARLRDEDGRSSEFTMSLWYPDLKNLIMEKSEKIVEILKAKGLWENIEYVIPSFGTAGEPIFPPLWTLSSEFTKHTFWGYDDNAQKSFRAWTQAKYATVDVANAAWKTSFASWDDVVVLKPRIQPGQYWDDMLTWYRDSKRDYIRWQVEQSLDLVMGTDKKIIIYVPGEEYTDEEWAAAVTSADGADMIKIMADSKFLIDLAAEKNCMLQYTGMPAEHEVRKLRAYMDNKGYNVEMWGENAGMIEYASDPEGLACIVNENNLFGLDYTHGHFLFKEATFEPSENMAKLKKAFETINDR